MEKSFKQVNKAVVKKDAMNLLLGKPVYVEDITPNDCLIAVSYTHLQGAGLGNKFLGHIRECDAIVHVVRCFDDDNIIHVVEDVNKPESVDPIRDIDAIDLELILADLEVVSNRLGRQQKAAKTGNKEMCIRDRSYQETT